MEKLTDNLISFWTEKLLFTKGLVKKKKLVAFKESLPVTHPLAADDYIKENLAKYLELTLDSTLASSILVDKKILNLNMARGFAQTCELMGLWHVAIEYHKRVIKLATTQNLEDVKAETYRKIGRVKRNLFDMEGALKDFEHAFKIFKSLNDNIGVAASYNSLGNVYLETGDLDRSEENFSQALTFAEEAKDSKLIAQINCNMGALANMRGDWDQAIIRYQDSLPRFEKIGHLRGMAQAYHNMSLTFLDKGESKKADEYSEKSLEYSYAVGDLGLAANTYLNKIRVFIINQDHFLALGYCKKAYESYQKFHDLAGIAEICKLVGVIFSEHLSWPLGKQYFQTSIMINQRIKNVSNLAETQFAFGLALKKRNQKDKALKYLTQGLENFQKLKYKLEIQKIEKEISSLGINFNPAS